MLTVFVRLDLADSHVVNDRAIGGEVNEFPRAIDHEGVILMLHCSLLVRGLSTNESGTVRGRFDAVLGR
jgi:hypothetical protein